MYRTLYPHQKRAMKYINQQPHRALFMAMRTGKTLPTIRTIEQTQPRYKRIGTRALIIAPNSALGSWMDELDAEGIDRYVLLEGTRAQRLDKLTSGARYYLLNTEGWRSIPEIASEDWVAWDHVVIDESTSIKNPKTRITKFFLNNKTFRNIPHRWALTGTPNPEGALNFWCQLAWLDSRAFGCRSFWAFRAKYFEPEMFNWYPTKEGEKLIADYLAERTFILRKQDAKIKVRTVTERRYIKMPRPWRKIYSDLEEEFVLRIDGGELGRTMFAGQRWHWLRQLCGGFVGGAPTWNGKLNELKYLLTNELASDQVVVWSCYNDELRGITRELQAQDISARYMCGEHSPSERRQMLKDFNRGRIRVWCIQQAVANMGIDISKADTQIFYTASPALRIHQQCQERLVNLNRKTPILTIFLIVEDSVDQDVIHSLIDKRWDSQALLNKAIKVRLKERA